jgi:hypothetical protein
MGVRWRRTREIKNNIAGACIEFKGRTNTSMLLIKYLQSVLNKEPVQKMYSITDGSPES